MGNTFFQDDGKVKGFVRIDKNGQIVEESNEIKMHTRSQNNLALRTHESDIISQGASLNKSNSAAHYRANTASPTAATDKAKFDAIKKHHSVVMNMIKKSKQRNSFDYLQTEISSNTS